MSKLKQLAQEIVEAGNIFFEIETKLDNLTYQILKHHDKTLTEKKFWELV